MIGQARLVQKLLHLAAGGLIGIVVRHQENVAGAQIPQNAGQLLDDAAAHPDGLDVHLVGLAAGAGILHPRPLGDGAV